MRRFYHPPADVTSPQSLAFSYKNQTPLTLSDNTYHHWCKVLRAKVGNDAILFDGTGGEYAAKLQHIDKKQAMVLLKSFCADNRKATVQVDIALAISRGDRMEYAIAKACEQGVRYIFPIISAYADHLNAKQLDKKQAHWQAVAVSACEQCGLNIVPKVFAIQNLESFLCSIDNTPCQYMAQKEATQKIILAVPTRIQSDKIFDFNQFSAQKSYLLLIGSEGGFSDDELQQIFAHNFLSWQIGERVLRTETAPVVAQSTLQAWASAKSYV